MARKLRHLTPRLLRKIVLEEKRKMQETLESGVEDIEKVSAEEVDADKLAGSLEKDIDFMKALKISESKLAKKLRRIREVKKKLRRRVLRRL